MGIKLLDHSSDKLHSVIKVVSVEATSLTVDVPGRDSNDKVGYSTTVKMNRSGVRSASFQHVKLIRDLQLLRSIYEEIPKP